MLFHDDATPAGNAVAIVCLNRLGHLLGESRYLDSADRCLRRAMPRLEESPLAAASLMAALEDSVSPPMHVVIAGSDPALCRELKQWVDGLDRVDCYLIEPPDDTLPGILREYRSDEALTAWLCHGTRCLPPVHSKAALKRQLMGGFDQQDNSEVE